MHIIKIDFFYQNEVLSWTFCDTCIDNIGCETYPTSVLKWWKLLADTRFIEYTDIPHISSLKQGTHGMEIASEDCTESELNWALE